MSGAQTQGGAPGAPTGQPATGQPAAWAQEGFAPGASFAADPNVAPTGGMMARTPAVAPVAQPSQDLSPMAMLQSYKSAPDRAAWMQQQQPAQPVQPWQPPQRMYVHQSMQNPPAFVMNQFAPGASFAPRKTGGLFGGMQQNGQGAK